jgi:hypothetical protein
MKISPLPSTGIAAVSTEAPKEVPTITMKTNVSPDRKVEVQPEAKVESTIPDNNEQASVVEDTKPLSPQAVALAKQRRANQVKELELKKREEALMAKESQTGNPQDIIARLKSQPLSVLQEHGVTYDQLTEAILNDQSGTNPKIAELEAKLKALEEGVNKTFTERDTQAEQQVLREMGREAEALAKQGDTFELVRETGSVKEVMRLIHQTYKQTGEVLDVPVAMQLVEDELFKDMSKIANTNKIKSALIPPQAQSAPKQTGIRTLTNRDSAPLTLGRRERAIMAMQGTLTKG